MCAINSEGMRKVFALMGPVMVSTWVQPINLVINSRFGSRLYDGAGVSAMEYSNNLYLVIAGTFILSITNVIFPRLSRLTAGGNESAFRDTIRQTVHSSLYFVLPMSAGLMAVSRPLISFLYGGGEFDGFAVDITSSALVFLSLGMAGYAVQNILSRAYFARQDGKTPLVAGAVSILVNIALCMVLTGPFRVAGLAFSSAVSSTVYALLLLLPMQRRGEGVLDGGMFLLAGLEKCALRRRHRSGRRRDAVPAGRRAPRGQAGGAALSGRLRPGRPGGLFPAHPGPGCARGQAGGLPGPGQGGLISPSPSLEF